MIYLEYVFPFTKFHPLPHPPTNPGGGEVNIHQFTTESSIRRKANTCPQLKYSHLVYHMTSWQVSVSCGHVAERMLLYSRTTSVYAVYMFHNLLPLSYKTFVETSWKRCALIWARTTFTTSNCLILSASSPIKWRLILPLLDSSWFLCLFTQKSSQLRVPLSQLLSKLRMAVKYLIILN